MCCASWGDHLADALAACVCRRVNVRASLTAVLVWGRHRHGVVGGCGQKQRAHKH